MTVGIWWAMLALAVGAFAVPACGEATFEDENGLEVAMDSLVTNMTYLNTDLGTVFSWQSDGSDWFRLQVPNHFITAQLSGAELGCIGAGMICTTQPQPVPWTNTVYWYVQGSFDAPRWARSSYLPTESTYQAAPGTNLSAVQNGNQVTFSWDRSQYATYYAFQIPNMVAATYTPAEVGCESVGPCQTVVTINTIGTGTWYVRTRGETLWGPWVSAQYTVGSSPSNLAKPTGLAFVQGPPGVTFSWDRVDYATEYRLQVPNRFVNTYDADTLGCGVGGGDVCSVEVQLPVSSGTWYVQAKNGDVLSGWASAPYEVLPDANNVLPPTALSATQVSDMVEFSWQKSQYAIEYKLQVVNNFVETIAASDLGCGDGQGDTCTASRTVKVGSGNWYVQAHGTGVWSSWAASTYSYVEVVEFSRIVLWNFDAQNLLPFEGSGVASRGVSNGGEAFFSGNPGLAWSLNNWSLTQTPDDNRYFGFEVSATDYSNLSISFDVRSSGTGPSAFEVRYSVDGGSSFTPVPDAGVTYAPDSAFHSFSVDLPEGANNSDGLIIQLHGYGATGTTGTCRIDNVVIGGYM